MRRTLRVAFSRRQAEVVVPLFALVVPLFALVVPLFALVVPLFALVVPAVCRAFNQRQAEVVVEREHARADELAPVCVCVCVCVCV